MQKLNERALFALLTSSFMVASACGNASRSFPGGSSAGAGDAGDSNNPGGGSSNHGGTASGGGTSHAGKSNGGGAATGGDAGTGSMGDAGEGGAPETPECGAPGTACCDGDLCVAHGACKSAQCQCSATYTACNDACIDFKTDAKNCGACGHSCLGGSCDTGTCQPVDVVTAQAGLNSMETDGTYLYWTGHDTPSSNPPSVYYVARRRVDGSDAVKVLAASEVGGSSLALAGDKLYWVAGQKLRACDLPDCATGATNAIAATIHSSQGYDLLFEPTKKALYISSYADYNSNNGAVTLLAAGSTTPVAVGPNPIGAAALVSDAANTYWLATSTYAADSQQSNGGVYKSRISDGTVTQVVSGLQGDIFNLAVGGNALFFSGNIQKPVATEAIIRAPLPNGLAAGTLPKFADVSNVYGMVADDTYLYFAQGSGSAGTISRCPVAACPTPEVIVPDILNPTMGTEDAVSVYWSSTTNLTAGATSVTVRRLAK